jgi:hypothetical protein
MLYYFVVADHSNPLATLSSSFVNSNNFGMSAGYLAVGLVHVSVVTSGFFHA